MTNLRLDLRLGMSGTEGGPPVVDPATLAASGYWINYPSATWTGTASAGTSSARSLAAGILPGSAVLGSRNVATFDGAASALISADPASSIYTSGASYSTSVLMRANTAGAPGGAIWQNPGVLTDSDGNFGIVYNTDGVSAFHFDGAFRSVTVALAVNTWAFVEAQYNGTNLRIRVNNGAWTSAAAGNISSITGTVRMGFGASTRYFDGRVAMALVIPGAPPSDTVSDQIYTWTRQAAQFGAY